MNDAHIRHELEEIAHVMQVPVESLEYLSGLDVDDLHVFRKAVVAYLHERYSADYRRLGIAVRFLPKRMATRMGIEYLPPRIMGRSAGVAFKRRPGRIMSKMSSLPPATIAEAAPFMDPRTLGNVALVIPTESRQLVNGIMDELIRRDDLGTLDRVLLYIGAEQERADIVEASADGEGGK
ncbi:hypothetical protein [Nocardia sp. Marseille-Q1738]